MTNEPTTKRRRIDGDAGDYLPTFVPTPATETQPSVEGDGLDNMDPFLSPATATSWPFDEFAHDPHYLASQEALRSLLFTTARSAAPTRAGTPDDGEESTGLVNNKQVLSKGRPVQYLKNYLSQVAPWVGAIFFTRILR